jgi:tRNA (Thr-GGU) A37 N-methylase
MSDDLRRGATVADALPAPQAGLICIGRIRTPWTERSACPRQGDAHGPICRIEVFEPWASGGALDGIDAHARLEVLYWLHLSRRDLRRQTPRHAATARGTFALRSPRRPNLIGTSIVALIGLEGATLLDLKPERGGGAPPAG